MAQQFFEELSRCLRKEQIESYNKEDRRLEIFLHGQPVLSVSPGNEVFLLPAGSKNPEANELYHRVAIAADSAFEYVEAMENTPLLRARGLENKFHLLADFGGAVLAGRERAAGQGYEFVTWIWDYEKVGVSHGHYYEDDFAGAKRDFAVRSGLISNASLFSKEELTELYRATEHLLADDPDLNDKQMKAIQEARTKIEFSVPDLDTQLEHRQDMAGDFEESLDYGDIYGRLDALLNLTNQSGYHVQYTEDGKMEFRVWDLSVDLQNASFASADSAGNRLAADCEIELEVPVSFGGRLLPPMRMTVKVSAGYTPRF